MGRNLTLGILFALIAAHIALAAGFATVTPFRTAGVLAGSRDPKTGGPQKVQDVGAPDERQHVNYVARLVHGGGFAVFDPKDPNLYERYQSHQPPAFYLLASAWATVTGVDLPPAPPATEGKEMTPDDGIKLRALNVVIGGITVVGVFMLAFWGYRRTEIALVAAAFAALLPMNVALSGAVSNDPLLICLCTWTLALLFKGIREGWSIRLAVAVGLLAGLAAMTKTTGVALLPILLLGILMKGEHRPKPAHIGAAVVALLILVTPWWLRNQRLYGDPFAMGAFNQAFVGSAQANDFIQSVGASGYWLDWVLAFTARSFIGVFGYMDIWLTNNGMRGGAIGIYQIGWLFLALAFVGWLMGLAREEREDRRIHLLGGLFSVIVLLLFVSFNSKYFQGQARYLLPALGPIACGVGLGLTTLLRGKWAAALAATVLVFGFVDAFALSKLPGEFSKRVEAARWIP